MWTGGLPRAADVLAARRARAARAAGADYDVVHDNQSLGYGLLRLRRLGLPLVATVHHPITVDRRLELAAATRLKRRLSLRRWYGFTRMQARVARAIPHAAHRLGELAPRHRRATSACTRTRSRVVPVGVDTERLPSRRRRRACPAGSSPVASSDSPMKGARVLLEAVAKLRDRARRRAGRGRHAQGRRAGRCALSTSSASRDRGPLRRRSADRALGRAVRLGRGRRRALALRRLLHPRGRGDGLRHAARRARRPARCPRSSGDGEPCCVDARRRRRPRRRARRAARRRAAPAARSGAAGRPPGRAALHLARRGRGHRRDLPPTRIEEASMLTVDFDAVPHRRRRAGARPRLRLRPARVRGVPPRRATWSPSTAAPRSCSRSRDCSRAMRAGRRGRRPATVARAVRADAARAAVPRRLLRRRDGVGGARAHPGRRAGDGRDRSRRAPGRPRRRHRAALVAGAGLLGAVATPTTRSRAATSASTAATSWRERLARRRPRRRRGSHHAHALHAPYWWLNCALGQREHCPSRLYHRLLVWDIMRRPWLTRVTEQALNPVLGKSLVIYADKRRQRAAAAAVLPPDALTRRPARSTAGRSRSAEPAARSRGSPAGTSTRGTTSSARWRCPSTGFTPRPTRLRLAAPDAGAGRVVAAQGRRRAS